MMNSRQIQAMIDASNEKFRTELASTKTDLNELNKKIDRQSRIIYGLEKKMSQKIETLEEKRVKDNRKIRGEIVELRAIIYHRQDLAHITASKQDGQLTPDGKIRTNALRKVSPWKDMTEKNIRERKKYFSRKLHGIPQEEYVKQRRSMTSKMQHHKNYKEGKRPNHPGFVLRNNMIQNDFPKKFVTARKVASKHGFR